MDILLGLHPLLLVPLLLSPVLHIVSACYALLSGLLQQLWVLVTNLHSFHASGNIDAQQVVYLPQHLPLEGEAAREGTSTQSALPLFLTSLAISSQVGLQLCLYLPLAGLAAWYLAHQAAHFVCSEN